MVNYKRSFTLDAQVRSGPSLSKVQGIQLEICTLPCCCAVTTSKNFRASKPLIHNQPIAQKGMSYLTLLTNSHIHRRFVTKIHKV